MSYGGAPTGLGTHGQLQVSLVPGTLMQQLRFSSTAIGLATLYIISPINRIYSLVPRPLIAGQKAVWGLGTRLAMVEK